MAAHPIGADHHNGAQAVERSGANRLGRCRWSLIGNLLSDLGLDRWPLAIESR